MPLKILVVDDERQLTRLIGRLLKSQGQTDIYSANTPQDAMALCDQHAFDLVLLDINLKSEKNGMDVLAYIKQKSPQTAVCMMSAYRDEYEYASLLSGAFKFIGKPATLADIREAIAWVVKSLSSQGACDA